MEVNSTENQSTCQLDPVVLNWFDVTSNTCLFVSGLIATIILSGWFMPPIGQILPDGWALMQATTAISVLFLCIALVLRKHKNNKRYSSICSFFAVLSIVIVGITLLEHWLGQDAILGTFLVAKNQLPLVYPTSIQSVSCFFVLALTLFIDPSRQDRIGYIFDVLIMVLVMLNLLYVAGYLYKASNLIQVTSAILISSQTLICIALLTFVQIARRAPFGTYTILVSKGIAGHTARIVLPFSVIISYLIILSQTKLTNTGFLETPYVSALTAVASAGIMIIVVLLLSRKINALEMRLRKITITDELTGAYNLRGLNMHGKQKLLDARRSTTPLSVLYIDVDGLKKVNDSLGHDTGSELLCDVVTLLHDNFRENDIVSRIGGDEFAIIANGSEDEIASAIKRLNKTVDEMNISGDRPYKIGFSIGKVNFDPRSNETIERLISRADTAMYKIKKERPTVLDESDNAQQFNTADT